MSGDSDYDPYAHRVTEHPLTNREAFFHLIKGTLGVGIIAMPLAFKYAGYLNGAFLSLLFGGILLGAIHILFDLIYDLCKRKHVPFMSYAEAMEVALQEGPPNLRLLSGCAHCFVYTVLGMYAFGMSCIYVIFIAEIMKDIAQGTGAESLDIRFFILATLVPLLIVFSINNLKPLWLLSFIANMLYIFGLLALVYFILSHDGSKTRRHAFGAWADLPLFYGIVLFAIEALGIFMSIEENMANPKDFLGLFGIMNAGIVFVFLFNIGMGFLGYWKYGEDVEGNITRNMPGDNILAVVSKAGFALSILISYALQGFVTVDLIWHRMFKSYAAEHNHKRYEFTMRVFIAVVSVFCAMLLPKFSESVILVGVFCLSILGLILPALMDICVKYPDNYGRFKICIFRDIIIMLFGLIGCIIGTYRSGYTIFSDLFSKNDDTDVYK